ncbi:unnamed protein product [Phaeothamnion confervicola]
MVNFILQEAHEKANEIKIKTEHDFNLEKQMLVHNAKLKIQEEYAQKEKDREIQDRITRSSMIGSSRVKKMTARDEVMQLLVRDATGQLAKVSTSSDYSNILKELIKQGLLKIEETKVEVYCRAADIDQVRSVLPSAVFDYKKLMKSQANLAVEPDVTLCEDKARCLPADSPGGVVLTAAHGRIVCANTLSARLDIAYQELLPKVRQLLFPVAA